MFKKITLNNFEQICKDLEQGKNDNTKSKIKYVKKVLRLKINKNYDKFLLIKAESRESDITDFRNTMLSMCAVITSVLAMLISIEFIDNISKWVIAMLGMLTAISCFRKITKFNFVGRWGQYVKVVLEEIENNKNYFK